MEDTLTSYTATTSCIPKFTLDELREGIATLKVGRAKDDAGIAAEMIKHGSTELHELILEIYNMVIQPDKLMPEEWSETRRRREAEDDEFRKSKRARRR